MYYFESYQAVPLLGHLAYTVNLIVSRTKNLVA